jgi:hypothetical protein
VLCSELSAHVFESVRSHRISSVRRGIKRLRSRSQREVRIFYWLARP